MTRSSEVSLVTPEGPARAITDPASDPWATVVLGHGAGGGVEAADLAALAASLPALGVTVVRVEQPWRVAGRRIATAPARLDLAWRAVLDQLPRSGPLVVGGRSAGARVACRTAADVGAEGVVAFAFPLHPPGRPERSRVAELAVPVPLVVVQGERDPFGRPQEFPAGVPVLPVAAADHGFRTRPADGQVAALREVTRAVAGWLGELVRP